jgi:hypothetical protein
MWAAECRAGSHHGSFANQGPFFPFVFIFSELLFFIKIDEERFRVAECNAFFDCSDLFGFFVVFSTCPNVKLR